MYPTPLYRYLYNDFPKHGFKWEVIEIVPIQINLLLWLKQDGQIDRQALNDSENDFQSIAIREYVSTSTRCGCNIYPRKHCLP